MNKKTYMRFVYFFFIFISLLGCQNSSEEKTEEGMTFSLAFHPEKGTKKEMSYEYKIESPSSKSELNFKVDFLFDVVSVTDNETDVKISYQNVTLNGHIDTLKFDIVAGQSDSTSPAMIYAEPYFTCLNHEFLVKYSREMSKISEELLSQKDLKSLTPPVNKVQFFTALPNKEIKIGDKWENSIELKSGKGMTVTAIYQLNGIEDHIAYISFSGDLDGSGEGFGHDYSMKGKLDGSLAVELSSGLTLHSEMVQDLILVLSEKETPMKFTIKQNIK